MFVPAEYDIDSVLHHHRLECGTQFEMVLVQIRIVELKQYKRMRTVELFSRPERLPRLPALSPVGALAFRS
jgi:hypothetical protein